MFSVIATSPTTYLTNSLPLISSLKAAVSPLQIVEIITDYSSHYPSRGLNLKAIRNQERSSSRHPSIAEMECSGKHAAERYAVVTGSNRGIGLETVRQLASQGVKVVLTARNEKRGMEALQSLHESGLTNVVFHQLDVLDPVSINSLANFIQEKFGRLDILVNNAGVSGVVVDEGGLKALNIDPSAWLSGEAYKLIELHGVIKTNYEKAEECLNINYYGVKRVTEALLPLLQLSPAGARIVNVSSLRSELKRIPGEHIRKELSDIESLTEERVEVVLRRFLHDLKENALEDNGWTLMLPAYSISKVTLNAYTRILAKKFPNMCINCVHPGYVKTDINWNTGIMTVEEGARGPVMLALLPDGEDLMAAILIVLKWLSFDSADSQDLTSATCSMELQLYASK